MYRLTPFKDRIPHYSTNTKFKDVKCMSIAELVIKNPEAMPSDLTRPDMPPLAALCWLRRTDRGSPQHLAAHVALPVQLTHQALCWKTCRGSVRNRVPNWGLFTSPVPESTEPRWVSLGSSAAPAVLWGAAMLELTYRNKAGRPFVLRSRKIRSWSVCIYTLKHL